MTIRVRPARLKDIAFVRALAVEMVVHGIPHTRRTDPQEVRARARASMAGLELTLTDPDFRVLVAESESTGESLGYIMLDFHTPESSTGEAQCVIHDIAVKREHWGAGVAQQLVETAVEITEKRGLHYIVGQVSKSNERSLGTALYTLGFEIERHQIVRRVTPRT